MIGQAQSGTGKTATFSIGILQQIDLDDHRTQALILAPTRELADQIFQVICSLGCYMKELRCLKLIGGESVRDNIKFLRQRTPHLVVGTPGRVLDMLEKSYLTPNYIKRLIIDEADEMLSRGFKEQIYHFFQQL